MTSAPDVIRYGDHPSQFLELTQPAGRSVGVAVLVHGGFWQAAYGAEYARPLVPSLLDRGWTTAVVEYRRVGDGGGYPATLDDVAAAVDRLAHVGVDLGEVVAIGHSAGGQLAAWLAGRPPLPSGAPGAPSRVAVHAAVLQAGVLDLHRAVTDDLGGGAVVGFLGGRPDEVPDRYDAADPAVVLASRVPVLCVHGGADVLVPPSQTTAFAARAHAVGADVCVRIVEGGDHFVVIDPASEAWAIALDWLDARRR